MERITTKCQESEVLLPDDDPLRDDERQAVVWADIERIYNPPDQNETFHRKWNKRCHKSDEAKKILGPDRIVLTNRTLDFLRNSRVKCHRNLCEYLWSVWQFVVPALVCWFRDLKYPGLLHESVMNYCKDRWVGMALRKDRSVVRSSGTWWLKNSLRRRRTRWESELSHFNLRAATIEQINRVKSILCERANTKREVNQVVVISKTARIDKFHPMPSSVWRGWIDGKKFISLITTLS